MTQSNSRRSGAASPRHYPTRRRFLQFSAAALSSAALTNCAKSTLDKQQATSTSPQATSQGDAKTLYIYTWADYNSEDLYKKFKDKTRISVIADVYDSNEAMLAKLQAGGGRQYSVIYPSDYMVRQMTEVNLLVKLDPSRLKGMENIMDRWKNPSYDTSSAHSIPFNWGTTGLLYHTDLVKSAPTDWDSLWQNKDALAGKMMMLDDVRETLGATLKSLGYSYNSTDPKQLEAAYKKLLAIKPALAGFKTYGWEDQINSGDLALVMSYSTLGNSLPEQNPKLKFVIPQSGTSVWTDTIAIPNTAPNLDAAYAWINFILEPENAAFAATQLKLGTPNKAGFALLPDKMKTSKTLFPPEALLSKCEGITPVGKATDIFDNYWTELRSS